MCRKTANVYIYGAGRNGTRLLDYLFDHDIKVQAFLVSNIEQNPPKIFGVPVKAASEHRQSSDEIVVCSVVFRFNNLPTDNYVAIINTVLSLNWQNVVFFSKLRNVS